MLRDEGELFAHRLTKAGVPVTLRRHATANHGFLHWVGVVDVADEAMDGIAAWMRATLAAKGGDTGR